MTRSVGKIILAAAGLFVVLVIGMTVRNFGPGGLTGDPVLSRAAVVLTPTAQAVATRLANSKSQASRVAPELRQNQQLLSFSGAVLVPPADLKPFAELPVSSVAGSGSTCVDSRCPQRYSIEYGEWSTGGIRLSGASGRDVFDAIRPAGCGNREYCVPAPKAGGRTSTTAEYFTDVALNDESRAVVVHLTCCAGPYWAVSWYEAVTDNSYLLEMSQRVADPYGLDLSFDNQESARQLCALASQLIQLASP